MKIPEGIYRLEEPGMAAFLFSGRREVMIDACLQGMMGCVYGTAGGMDSAAAVLGDFCFLAGKPEERLIAWDYGAAVPAPGAAGCSLAGAYKKDPGRPGQGAYPVCHKKEGDCFDWQAAGLAETLPAGITLSRIHGELYGKCLKEEWSRDLVSCFPSCEAYEAMGLGVAASGETSCWQEPPPMPGAGTPLRSRSIPGRI